VPGSSVAVVLPFLFSLPFIQGSFQVELFR
jgi:hypothetical protein